MSLRFAFNAKLFAGAGLCALLSVPASAAVFDFEAFSAGNIITNQLPGVTVSATGGSGDAMIFDTDNVTGGDVDQESPFIGINGEPQLFPGNVLIVSEDGDSSDPDDFAGGGSISFVFDAPVTVNSINFFDAEGGDTVTLDGVVIGTAGDSNTLDDVFPNLYESLATNNAVSGTTLTISFVGSGAIDSVDVSAVPLPAAGWLFGSAIVAMFASRRRQKPAV